MYLIEAYDDGSATVGFETGDVCVTDQDIHFRTLNGELIKTYPKGSVVEVCGCREYKGNFKNFRIKFEDGHIEVVMEFRLDHGDADIHDMKQGAPTDFVVQWHEGAIWKHTRVLAWSMEEATQRVVDMINAYGDPDRIDGITFREPVLAEGFDKGDQWTMGWLGV